MAGLRHLSARLERVVGIAPLAIVAGVVFVVAALTLAFRDGGSSTLARSTTTTTSTTVASVAFPDFGKVSFTITPSNGPPATFCGLLAENEQQQAKGLMGQRSLGGYDAMLFRFKNDSNAAFYTANVPVPLSVAWFDAKGLFVSSTDMPVCSEVDPAKCPLYQASGIYRDAIEVMQGGLGELGIGSGSTLSVGGPCA